MTLPEELQQLTAEVTELLGQRGLDVCHPLSLAWCARSGDFRRGNSARHVFTVTQLLLAPPPRVTPAPPPAVGTPQVQ